MDLMGIDNFIGNFAGGLITVLIGAVVTIIPSWFVISRIKRLITMAGCKKRANNFFSKDSHYIINGKEGYLDEINKTHIVLKNNKEDTTKVHLFPLDKVDSLDFTKITAKQD